jgi:hypothetical protein
MVAQRHEEVLDARERLSRQLDEHVSRATATAAAAGSELPGEIGASVCRRSTSALVSRAEPGIERWTLAATSRE